MSTHTQLKKKKIDTYEAIFAQRGYRYDKAMRLYPHARAFEFKHLIEKFDYHPGMTIADIPAGGEYLKHYLPDDCCYVGFEPCHAFQHNTPSTSTFFPLPIKSGTIDIIMSLAGLHHVDNKMQLFHEFKRIAKPNSSLAMADVYQDSPTAMFLDEFVGQHNPMGHQGLYLSASTLDELTRAHWTIQSAELTHLHWVFHDLDSMGNFCQQLFHLSCSTQKIIDAIDNWLGIEALSNSLIGMNWPLYTIIARQGG